MTREDFEIKREDIIDKKEKEKEKYKAEIKKLNQKLSELKSNISLINKQIDTILEYSEELDFNDFLKVVAYLVSQIEKEEYSIQKYTIPLIECDNIIASQKPLRRSWWEEEVIEGSLIYLVKSDNEDKALEEIKEKFKPTIPSLKNFIIQTQNLTTPSKYYISLCFYKNYTPPKIIRMDEMGDNLELICTTNFMASDPNNSIDLILCDHKFSYIKEFLYEVLSYQLENPNFSITLDEMLSLANTYIRKNTSSKSKSKKLIPNPHN